MSNYYTNDFAGITGAARAIVDGSEGGSIIPRSLIMGRYIVSVEAVNVVDQSALADINEPLFIRDDERWLFNELVWASTKAHAAGDGAFASYWMSSDNVLFIDVNRSFDDLDEALEVAYKTGQLAVFDTVTGEDIEVHEEIFALDLTN